MMTKNYLLFDFILLGPVFKSKQKRFLVGDMKWQMGDLFLFVFFSLGPCKDPMQAKRFLNVWHCIRNFGESLTLHYLSVIPSFHLS